MHTVWPPDTIPNVATPFTRVGLVMSAPGEFWAANNRGVYRSVDAGRSWERVTLAWPDAYTRGNVLAFHVRTDR